MACGSHLVKCKSCATVLAAVVPNGLTSIPSSDESGCSICQRFSTLYDAVQAADAEWATFENKRDSLTKSVARDKHKKARMEFDNWLMTIEAPPIARTKERVACLEDATPQAQDLVHGSEGPHLGITCRSSHSPTNQHSILSEELDPGLQQQNDALLSFRPSPKRSRSISSLPEQKRLKFCDTVEFHETYRSSDEYHRPSKLYVPGRNAPPEGFEYMDTSGSGQTFLRFTQMKKVGAKWVELTEEELTKKSKSPRRMPAQQAVNAVELQEAKGDAAGVLEKNEEMPSNARTARLARRTKEAYAVSSARGKSTRRAGNRFARKVEEMLVDSTPAETEQPAVEPAPPSSASAIEEVKPVADKGLSVPQEIGLRSEERKRVGKPSIAVIEKGSIETMRNDERQEPESYHRELHSNTPVGGTTADQSESIECDCNTRTKIVETGPNHAVAQNHQLTERASQTSCVGWEHTYYPTTTLHGQNVAATTAEQCPRSQIEMN